VKLQNCISQFQDIFHSKLKQQVQKLFTENLLSMATFCKAEQW